VNRFVQRLLRHGLELKKGKIEVLQANLGKFCNLACVHCHVEAGPTKTRENMSRETAEAVVRFLGEGNVRTLDLTGGAPELNPNFRTLVTEARKRSIHVMDRCNLTVLFEKGMDDLGTFLADHQVEIIASMPCYSRLNVDKQRGKGTFDQSIQALLYLNQLGYGKTGTGLKLILFDNPVGAHLPPAQSTLEENYKVRLREDFGITFNELYCITNMPITRYAKYLKALNQYEVYVELLVNHFNPHAADGLMCRNTLSVSWDGKLYDCDFNQAVGMNLRNGHALTIFDVKLNQIEDSDVLTGEHCFGCMAGCGSSCQGTLTEQVHS
jgi:radical SAM/Cys-rich protein